MSLSPQFIRIHFIPVCTGILLTVIFSWIVFSAFPDNALMLMHGVFCLGGIVIGMLTPAWTVDHRGTNGVFYMALGWFAYIFRSPQLFPDVTSLSEWGFEVMGNNVFNGFCIIAGLFLGTFVRRVWRLDPLNPSAHLWHKIRQATKAGYAISRQTLDRIIQPKVPRDWTSHKTTYTNPTTTREKDHWKK